MEFINRITEAAHEDKIVADLTAGQSGDFDLAVLFVVPSSGYDLQAITRAIQSKLRVRHFFACTSAGTIGAQQEIEGRPSASLLLAKMPGVKITPFYLNQAQLEAINKPEDWYNFLEIYPNESPCFLLLPDPFMIDMYTLLAGLNGAYKGACVVGGLASAASSPGENLLILDGQCFNEGAIALALTGNIQVETIVSQGCRPIGETYIVTKADENVIYELAGKPFYIVMEEVFKYATEQDRALAQEAVFVGIAMNEYTHQFKHGDFLIRGVVAIDQTSGAGAIADYIKPGQTVQFHLRDAQTAREDFHEMLRVHNAKIQGPKPQGALVFSCNGRGMNLFKEKDHDIKIIQEYLGPMPACGFFCAGEIGPVGEKTFLHGFTNSTVLFYPANSHPKS